MTANLLSTIVLAAEENGVTEPTSGPEAFGIGSVVLLVAVAVVLGWMGYLYVNSRRARDAAVEETPHNLRPYISDDELENRRTTRVLRGALIGAGLLAVVLPWYAFDEPGRQADAAEAQAELDIEAGAHWYETFSCVNCHGAGLGGGAAPFTEPRSGVATSWLVPSLDDVLYRYDEEEVRTVIVYGRPGTPMPANGLDGGGAMSVQEVDQVLAFIRANQISQEEAAARAGTQVGLALSRMAEGEAVLARLIMLQEAQIADVEAAPDKMAVVGEFPEAIKDLLSADGTCTDRSATLVTATCDSPGPDADRDGLADAAEEQLTEYAATALDVLQVLQTSGEFAGQYRPNGDYQVMFDRTTGFTNQTGDGTPIPDLDAASAFLEALEADVLVTGVTAERQDQFLAGLRDGLAFLQASAEARLWEVDFAAVQRAMNERQGTDWEFAVAETAEGETPPQRFLVGGNDAERAVGLFNAYCARCHTGGYSAGAPFQTGQGSGAWGPALQSGRSLVQFPNWLDQVAFIVEGSEFQVHYGVNGLGSGRMPAFGQVLSERDIQLIVMYERSL